MSYSAYLSAPSTLRELGQGADSKAAYAKLQTHVVMLAHAHLWAASRMAMRRSGPSNT
jgi:hypothetical protein